jgi:hypothetical protein
MLQVPHQDRYCMRKLLQFPAHVFSKLNNVNRDAAFYIFSFRKEALNGEELYSTVEEINEIVDNSLILK